MLLLELVSLGYRDIEDVYSVPSSPVMWVTRSSPVTSFNSKRLLCFICGMKSLQEARTNELK